MGVRSTAQVVETFLGSFLLVSSVTEPAFGGTMPEGILQPESVENSGKGRKGKTDERFQGIFQSEEKQKAKESKRTKFREGSRNHGGISSP